MSAVVNEEVDGTPSGSFDPEDPSSRYSNRELSWLEFNARVLAQAEDPRIPLLERVKFCAIYASNLDEFYMVRVAGLKDQVAAGVTTKPPDGLTPLAQLRRIREMAEDQMRRLEQVHVDQLLPALADEGLEIVRWEDLDEDERKQATSEFESHVFPVLTPLAVDPGHPFPYISNLSLNLAVLVTEPDSGRRRFARLKVPPTLPRFTELLSGRFVPIEQVIAAHLGMLFPGMSVSGAWPFRVTRNADLAIDDEDADDLLAAVEIELRRRRFGRAIRLETDETMPIETLRLLLRELDLDDEDVYQFGGLLDCTGYWEIADIDRPNLKQPTFKGVTPRRLQNVESSDEFFRRIRNDDVLVHHPYDSFSRSVSEFVRQASLDPKVLAIKLTLYRTSGDSPIVESLIRAAEQGKQVAALVELKARFDERNNIGWARRLEEAGVHVVYGLVGLKTHCKTTLVVRNEGDGVRRYCHIGTGNYNPKTARIYEDLGFLTANADVGDDLTQLFNFLTGFGRNVEYERLLVAPRELRKRLGELIANEATSDPPGRITFKMNSLVDADLIEELYAASQAGVEIDLIVRGICCLRPGVPGMSENITVRSLVGRFLEHSRVFYFANGKGPGESAFFLGSADLMPRNLDRRVEVLVRVEGEESERRLQEVFDVNFADDTLAWELLPSGVYQRVDGGTSSAHDRFEEIAQARAAVGQTAGEWLNRVRPPVPHQDRTWRAHAANGQPADSSEFDEEVSDETVRAAGCVVWRQRGDAVELLVVHRPRYKDWTFAKGKVEPGEDDLACARREVEEESGMTGEIGIELESVRYVDHKGRDKTVRYWVMALEGGSFRPNDEVDEIRWLAPDETVALLTYPHDVGLVGQFLSSLRI